MNNSKGYLRCDFAFIFDLLSIAQVKYNKGLPVAKYYNDLEESLLAQLGHEKLNEVVSSDEYVALYDANAKTFDMVDKAKINTCLASDVDDCNTERFHAKQKLQEKFFGTQLEEVKRT